MTEKRFKLDIGDDYSFIDDIIQDETYTIYNDRFKEVWGQKIVDLLNSLSDENEQLRKKTEMDKNDFFISEAKRMRLLAFIEDNGLRKEYSEWERRIYDE